MIISGTTYIIVFIKNHAYIMHGTKDYTGMCVISVYYCGKPERASLKNSVRVIITAFRQYDVHTVIYITLIIRAV